MASLFRYSTCAPSAARTELPSCCLKQHISKPLHPTPSSSNRSPSSFTTPLHELAYSYHTVTLSSYNSWATSDQKGEILFPKSARKPALKADIQTPQFPHADCSSYPKAKSTLKKGQNSRIHLWLWAASLGQPYKAVLIILPFPTLCLSTFLSGTGGKKRTSKVRQGFQCLA